MSNAEHELPQGWVLAKLGELFTANYGKALKESNRTTSGPIPVYGSNGVVGYHDKALVVGPSLIVGRKGAAGAVHLAKTDCWPIDTTYWIQPSDSVLLKYAYYGLINLGLSQLDRSTAIPGLNRDDLYSQVLPIAPLPEQRRIVAKIEELFSRLDAGVAALKRVQAALKRYKASVLKAACEGRLVPQDPSDEPADVLVGRVLAERRAKWEDDLRVKGKDPRKAKYKEPESPSSGELIELPTNWCWATLDQLLGEPLTNGRSAPDALNGFPVLRLTALRDGRIDLSETKVGALAEADAQRFAVRRGDFLVSRGNGSVSLVGRGGLVETEPELIAFPDLLIRVNVNRKVYLPELLRAIWDAPSVRSQIETTARTTAGIHKINQGDLETLAVPVPPLKHQSRLVAEIDRRLSIANEIETATHANLVRSIRLRQSILAQAFSGKLDQQCP